MSRAELKGFLKTPSVLPLSSRGHSWWINSATLHMCKDTCQMIFPSILNDREKHELPRAIYRSRHMVLFTVQLCDHVYQRWQACLQVLRLIPGLVWPITWSIAVSYQWHEQQTICTMTTTTFILSEYFPMCANKGLCYLKLRGKYQLTSSSGGGGGGSSSSSSSSSSNSSKID